jgi:alpha-mannosidase/mannosylglycerate hydrolase
VTLTAKAHGARVDDALRLVSEGDRGDEYNFDPVPGGEVADRLERVRVRATRRGADAVLRIDGALQVPLELAAGRADRSSRRTALPVSLELRLSPGLDRVDVALRVENTARDHRLRLLFGAPFAARRFEAESAFEIAERPIAPAPDSFGSPRPAERPIGAVPQRSFATLEGAGDLALTVANRGVAEVEAVPLGEDAAALALTVFRAVGWLSRPDLALRPGPAGPALATPGAQVPGRHVAEASLRLHRRGDVRRIAEAHGFAFPPLAFPCGEGGSGPLRDGVRLLAVDDPEIVVSAIEPRGGGDAEVRLLNASGAAREARVEWCAPCEAITAVDLAGRPCTRVAWRAASPASGVIGLAPWRIATLRIDRRADPGP